MKKVSIFELFHLVSLFSCRALLVLTIGSLLMTSPSVRADDTSSDAPSGFSSVIKNTKGVILRVPVNANGEENTNAAEMKFYRGGERVIAGEQLVSAWESAVSVEEDAAVLGQNGPAVNPADDSSTWGWYFWRWNGWMYPYYYFNYVPTFYYFNVWYSYPYYNFWNFNFYRFYYYYW